MSTGARVELSLGGEWVDVTADALTRDPITITRGRPDQSSQTDPSRCRITLRNAGGKYSPRNPRSPYYGLLGRNTPIRVSAAGSRTYLRANGGNVSTPSASALDITSDVDVRIDASLGDWRPAETRTLLSRWDTSATQHSYRLVLLPTGQLRFQWSETGSGPSALAATSTVPVTVPDGGRLAVRATLEVVSGGGGLAGFFYTAPTMDGPWVQLGIPTGSPSPTVVANSPLPLLICGQIPGSTFLPATGIVYAVEVRDGIDGPPLANPDFTAEAAGTTSFTDAAGRTWTVSEPTEISNLVTRFMGEVSSWPPRWDVSGQDLTTPIEAAGILRRLGQGARPLDSALRRQIPPQDPQAYWPLEEGPSATQAFSPMPGVAPMKAQGMRWAAAGDLPSSAPLPMVTSANGALCEFTAPVPAPAVAVTAWSVQCVYRIDQINAAEATLLRIQASSGAARQWLLQQSGTSSRLIVLDAAGAELGNWQFETGSNLYNQWTHLQVFTQQVGANTEWRIIWTNVGGDAGSVNGSIVGANGFPSALTSPVGGYSANMDGLALGHLSVWRWGYGGGTPLAGAIDSWAGETAAARMTRLSDEEGVPLEVLGDGAAAERVGPQGRLTLPAALVEAADADGGLLIEQTDSLGLAYRPRASLYRQDARLALRYGTDREVAPPLEPVDDDAEVRNDVTVTRAGGSSGRVVREDGPLSVLPPPDGVGLYAEALTLSLFEDEQTEPQAAWRVHLATWDAARYPRVSVRLHSAPHLIEAACDLILGDRMTISDPPPWLPPDLIDLIALGYEEALGLETWDITYNCLPGGPWNVAVADDPVYGHADTDGSVLAAAATDTQSGLLVATTAGLPWTTDPAEAPWDVAVGGERMTVTAVDDFADTFARTVAAGGWGTASSGQAWSVLGGSAAAFSVAPSTGSVALAVLSTRHIATLADTVCPDTEAEVTLLAPAAAVTGDGVTAGIALRVQSEGTHYHARLQWQPGGDVLLCLSRTIAGSRTNFAVVTIGTYTASQTWRIRARLQGDTFQARAWPTSGRDPVAWQAEATDTQITTAGPLGLLGYLQPANTNALPLAIRYRDLLVHTPQTMTVVRAVNGITKTHAAGADVRLADTPYTAL